MSAGGMRRQSLSLEIGALVHVEVHLSGVPWWPQLGMKLSKLDRLSHQLELQLAKLGERG